MCRWGSPKGPPSELSWLLSAGGGGEAVCAIGVTGHGVDQIRCLGHPARKDREPKHDGDDEEGIGSHCSDGEHDTGHIATRPPPGLHDLVVLDVHERTDERHNRCGHTYGYGGRDGQLGDERNHEYCHNEQ